MRSTVSTPAHTVLGIGTDIFLKPDLARRAAERVHEGIAGGDSPTIVCVDRNGLWNADSIAGFAGLLSRGGIHVATITRAQVDETFAGQLISGLVPVILPSPDDEVGDDEYTIALAVTLGCSPMFWTPSDCLMTADPARCNDAAVLEHVSFVEMMEAGIAEHGIIGANATQLAWSTGTNFKVLAIESGRWTSVTHDTYTKRVRPVAAIAVTSDIALIEMRKPGLAADATLDMCGALLEKLAREHVSIEQLQFLVNGVRFACDRREVPAAFKYGEAIGFVPRVLEPCAKLCLIGAAMCAVSGVLYSILQTLRDAGVRPLHISDSNVTVSLIVAQEDAARAEQALHETFVLSERISPAKQIAFDTKTRLLRVRDRCEKLGTRQARLLNFFLDNIGKVIDVERATREVFGHCTPQGIAALRVHVHNLRKKIEDDPENPKYILTVPNRGYTFARHWSSTSHANRAK